MSDRAPIHRDTSQIGPLLAPFGFLILWATGFPVAKIAVAYAEPLTLLSLRYALALLVIAPVFVAMRPPWPADRAAWGHGIVVGVLMQGAYFSFAYLALRFGASAGTVALITSLQPLVVAALAGAVTGERIGPLQWLGFVFGLSGAILVIGARSLIEAGSALGITCAIIALLGISGATLWEKRFGRGGHPVTQNLVQYAVGLVFVFPLAFWFEPLRVSWSLPFAAALAYLVLGNSIVAITLLLFMIRRGAAARVSALFFMVPPLAALIAYFMLGEAMPPLAWVGFALAGAGLFLVTRAGKSAREG